MAHLLQIGLSNAIVSGVLALLAVGASRLCRRPALAHALWVLVLLKLITPPVHIIPIEWPAHAEEALTDISSVAMVTVQDEPEGPTVDEAPAVAGEEAFIEPIDMAALADGPAEEAAAQQDAPVNDRSASPATAAVNKAAVGLRR